MGLILAQPRVAAPPVTNPPSAAAAAQPPASWHPALYLVIAYIFVTYTRLPEILLILTGHGLRLGLIAAILAVLVVLLSGGIFRVFSSRIVLALLSFTAWLMLSTPFSVWRHGSFDTLVFWSVSLISLILLAGCIDGLEQCRKAMYAMAVSLLVIEALTFVLGVSSATKDVGRFSLVSGTFGNPNDFATLLLLGLPFCLLVVRTRSGLSVLRVACFLALILVPITVVRTGSRGGLLALLVIFLLYFFSVPPLQKVPLAVGALLLAVAAVLVSSSDALERYKTLFLSGDGAYLANSAEESAALSTRIRKEMFEHSVSLTLRHPVLGIGPGMFAVADAKDAEEQKRLAAWRQTHNTYTEISSEGGLPALLFYLAALFFCFQTTRSARKFAAQHPELPALGDMAFCLRLSVLTFTITAVFASNAYYFYFPLVAGLCAGFERSVNSAMEALKRHDGSLPAAAVGRMAPVRQRTPAPRAI